MFTENILPALNKVAWPQRIKVNSSSKLFFDYGNIRAKRNAFKSSKSIKTKHPKNRNNWDAFGGELLFHNNKKLNFRPLEICLPNKFIEILPLELRFLNSKWLILGTYKSPSQNEPTNFSEIQKLLTYRSSYGFTVSYILNFTFFFTNEQYWNFSTALVFSNFHLSQSNLIPQNTIISVHYLFMKLFH